MSTQVAISTLIDEAQLVVVLMDVIRVSLSYSVDINYFLGSEAGQANSLRELS